MAREVVRSLGAAGPQRRPGAKGRRATTGGPGRRAAHCSATRVETTLVVVNGKGPSLGRGGKQALDVLATADTNSRYSRACNNALREDMYTESISY